MRVVPFVWCECAARQAVGQPLDKARTLSPCEVMGVQKCDESDGQESSRDARAGQIGIAGTRVASVVRVSS